MEPKSSRNSTRRASKDQKNPPRRLLERLLAIMVDPEDSKKALVAKKRPRKFAGAQDFSKKPFWCRSGVHFGDLFL